ncbi:12389_t:CDS:2, partial [Acaulospora morrowiae]
MSYLERSLNIGLDNKLPFVNVDKWFQVTVHKRNKQIVLHKDSVDYLDIPYVFF